jgi:hypothetical protein
MKTRDYSVTIQVNASAPEAFKCINEVTKWWTENLQGSSKKLNDEFTVQFGDVHVSTQKIVELIPDKRVVWLVTDSKLNFIHDKQEWTGTRIRFEISEEGNKTDGFRTQVKFMHSALGECFDACSNAWVGYVKGSLLSLISTGKGKPTPKE